MLSVCSPQAAFVFPVAGCATVQRRCPVEMQIMAFQAEIACHLQAEKRGPMCKAISSLGQSDNASAVWADVVGLPV